MAITLIDDQIGEVELNDFVEYVDKTYKVITVDSMIEIAPLFGCLARNRHFLEDLIIRELQDLETFQNNNPYSSQSLDLAVASGKFFIRANVWLPREQLHSINTIGEAQLFSYDLAHDHNFDLLTVGYFGPGYKTDIYEYDYKRVRGEVGEVVDITFLESTTLPEGKIMIYRASQDIHVQKYPDDFSISLNVLAPARAPLRDQFVFDLRTKSISKILRSTFIGQKLLIEAAASLCSGNVDDVLHCISNSHQSLRTREVARNALLNRRSVPTLSDYQSTVTVEQNTYSDQH